MPRLSRRRPDVVTCSRLVVTWLFPQPLNWLIDPKHKQTNFTVWQTHELVPAAKTHTKLNLRADNATSTHKTQIKPDGSTDKKRA